MIGLNTQVLADDGPAGSAAGHLATPPVYVELVGVTEIKPPAYKTKTEDNDDLLSGPVNIYLASLSDGSEITITQKYTAAAWQRNFALQLSTWPGNAGGLITRTIKIVFPDGLAIIVPVIWTEVPPADDVKNQPIIMFKSTLKVNGLLTILPPAPAA